MNKSFLAYQLSIDSLTVFSALKRDPVIHGLRILFGELAKAGSSQDDADAPGASTRTVGASTRTADASARTADASARTADASTRTAGLVALYSDILAALYPSTSDLSEYIHDLVLADDNFYVLSVAAGKPLSDEIQTAARRELNQLQDLASLPSSTITEALGYQGPLPSWTNSKIYLLSDFTAKLERIPVTGCGIFAEFTFFRIVDDGAGTAFASPDPRSWGPAAAYRLPQGSPVGWPAFGRDTGWTGRQASSGWPAFEAGTGAAAYGRLATGGRIVPVAHPDAQKLEQLFGYEREQELILRNTEALLDGTGASNILLYGDAGTGKSSTIKAVAAEYAHRGLRLIEVKKNQLFRIPDLLDQLADNPLKFILFIDDLSFSGNDDNFSALKATLEGSVAGCAGNTVIYATSNRRHLVKETMGDRSGDELHVNDTLQETMSLAARFGLTITFSKPDRDEYLDIVRALAVEYGVELPDDELCRKAEAHAIRRNGRSPRTAKQFVELLKIGL